MSGAIDAFIKKHRLAMSSQAKDFRITVEEAGELVACIALLNTNQGDLKSLEKKLDLIIKNQQKLETSTGDHLDGGSFR